MAVVFEGPGRVRPQHGPRLALQLPPAERGAGWERELAPPVLKEVEVVPTLLSDDAHTIGLPPRVTQPSVGRYVREVKHYRDASYGTHFGQYSGVNLLPVFGERMKTVPTVPRTHHHFGTGVNAGYHDEKLHPTVLELKVLADRANWVPAPSDASATVVRLTRPAQLYPKERQALFPFPKDPAGTNCPPPPPPLSTSRLQPAADAPGKDLVLPMRFAAVEYLCDEGADSLHLYRPSACSSLLWPTPFWYNGSLERPAKPVGKADDYGFCKLLKECGPVDVGEAVQVDATEYYIPGQIADEGKCAEPEPEKESPPAARERRPLYERRVVPWRPPHEHYQLQPWIGQDRQQLERVGLAYRARACLEHYNKYPPGRQPAIPQRRCDYPDLKLSVL